MGESRRSEAYRVVWLVRRLFRALAQRSDVTLEPLGISSADRAVMEFLYPDQRLSVPEIARRYQVSRQHVQLTANRLIENRLLLSKPNPGHKRSPHLVLSAKGRALFRNILARDRALLEELFADIGETDIGITRATLEALLERMMNEDRRG